MLRLTASPTVAELMRDKVRFKYYPRLKLWYCMQPTGSLSDTVGTGMSMEQAYSDMLRNLNNRTIVRIAPTRLK